MRDTKWKWEMVGGIIKHCENEKVVVQIARLFSKRGFNEIQAYSSPLLHCKCLQPNNTHSTLSGLEITFNRTFVG